MERSCPLHSWGAHLDNQNTTFININVLQYIIIKNITSVFSEMGKEIIIDSCLPNGGLCETCVHTHPIL